MADDKKNIPDAGKVDEPPRLGKVEPVKANPRGQGQPASAKAEAPKDKDAPAPAKKGALQPSKDEKQTTISGMVDPAPAGKVVDFTATREGAAKGTPPEKVVAPDKGKQADKAKEAAKPRKSRPPKADKAAPDKAKPQSRDKPSQSKPLAGKDTPAKAETLAASELPAEPRDATRPVKEEIVYLDLSELHAFKDLYAGVIENHNRNGLLVSDTLKLVQEGRTPILLTERKEHAVLLANQLSDQVKHVFLLIGSDKQKDKREKLTALQNMPDDEDVVVVATGKYIGEGFDAPRLDTLLLAMPISWKGTLAQYAGRLHRNYEGKQEVRIYDYVDIHVPTLERMYHKRLKGYAELGYQVKFGAADQPISVIYDGHSSMLPFEQDLDDAARSVVIVSPYLQKGRIVKLLPSLQKAVASGVEIAIHTRTADSRELSNQESVCEAIKMMRQTGIVVHTHKELNQRYAVVDESVVWYGGVDFLAFGRKDTDVLRFKNPDIAGEFLSLSGHAESEQLVMEDI